MRRAILPLALALMFAPALRATGTGSISGLVTDTDGNPCSGVTIKPYSYVVPGGYWAPLLGATVQTDATGAYTLGGLVAGSYRLQFTDDDLHRYIAEFYNDASDVYAADNVAVADSAVTGIDAQLAKSSRIVVTTVKALSQNAITGEYYTVTGSAPGFAIEARSAPGGVVDINAYPYVGTRNPATDRYEIYDLPPGEYLVRLYDFDYYFTPEETLVTIASGGTTTDVTLTTYKFGSFAGRVTDSLGNPLVGVKVTATSFGQNFPARTATTDAAGNYNVDGVVASAYTLSFEDPAGRYFTGYYKQPAPGADPAQPTPAYVSEPDFATQSDGWPTAPNLFETKNLGITGLSEASSISGTVRNKGGSGIGGITVQLYRLNSTSGDYDPVSYASTSNGTSTTAGSYTLGPLVPGDYRIKFFQPYSTLYVPEFYNDKADLASADTISLGAVEHLAGVDAVLDAYDPTISISGSLLPFASTEGTASAAQTFSVYGNYLTANLLISAPAGYEISTDGSAYNSSMSFTPSFNSVALPTLYVRLASSASAGAVSGSIEITSTGATNQSIPVTGTVSSDYGSWADSYGLAGDNRLGPADVDRDGFSNDREYAFGTDPTAPDATLLKITRTPTGYTLSWIERNTGVTYSVVSTTNLATTPFTNDPDAVVTASADQSGVPFGYARKEASFGYSPSIRAKTSSVKGSLNAAVR